MATVKHQITLALLVIPFLVGATYCSFRIYNLAHERAAIKADYSSINNITYGLLSVDAWKDHLVRIVSNRIDEFELSAEQEKVIQLQVESVLHAVIDKADTIMHQKRKSLKGIVRKAVINALVSERKIHAKVPEFATTIVREIKKDENKKKMKELVLSKIKEYGAITYDSSNDVARLEMLLSKYGATDVPTFNANIEERSDVLGAELYKLALIEIGIVVLFMSLWMFFMKYRHVHNLLFSASVALALIVLVAGLTAPMIEIDARIKEMSFFLLGEKLIFNDQIIFFQSKSIVDVVHVLITNGHWDSMVVGMLILIFSILFPLAKLIGSRFYLVGNSGWRTSKVVRFFALKSGKWSMADVYVVAIFMAYIGFKSILDNQLANLNFKTQSLASISTNETTLQPGFMLFICYVIYSLVLSTLLEKIKGSATDKFRLFSPVFRMLGSVKRPGHAHDVAAKTVSHH
ncbi:paraquat-inducible protein A [Chryseolinea sp. T2]|uniref:paraquat-inducible protein A n=1 Tax=Chryseolinea sp. T2 TaxID=3129255 RepID=UPI003077C9C8